MASRCFLHILNSRQYRAVTGASPPSRPPSAADYAEAGLPWFDYYGGDLEAPSGSAALAGLDSVAAKGIKKGETPLPGNDSIAPGEVIMLGKGPKPVREGSF